MTKRQKYNRRWYQKNKKRVGAVTRIWRRKNKKRVAGYSRAWVKKNRKRHNSKSLRWYNKNKKKALARHRVWRNKNRKRINFRKRTWRKRHSRQVKANRLKHEYGLTMREFSLLRKAQENCCAVCRKTFRKTPCIDHDHETGRVRGLLCNTCNTGIGMLKDSVIVVESAARYLRRAA